MKTEPVIRAAAKHLLRLTPQAMQTDFEHGQWWVTDKRTGRQWSAIEAEGPGTWAGWSFEQVTNGEDE